MPAVQADLSSDYDMMAEAALRQDLHDRLIKVLDLRNLETENLGEEVLRARSHDAIVAIVDEMEAAGEWVDELDWERIIADVLDEVHG